MEQTNQLHPLWWHGELKVLHVLITIHYMTTISIYDVPQLQEEPLHSLFNCLNTLQAYTPSTAKRKYNYSEKGHSTRLQNTVYMVSLPQITTWKFYTVIKELTKFELLHESKNWLENKTSNSWSTYHDVLLLYKKMYWVVKKNVYAIHVVQLLSHQK